MYTGYHSYNECEISQPAKPHLSHVVLETIFAPRYASSWAKLHRLYDRYGHIVTQL